MLYQARTILEKEHYKIHPIPVYWCGFKSDTVMMERAGWEFHYEYELYCNQYRFAAHNNYLGLYCIFREFDFDAMMNHGFFMQGTIAKDVIVQHDMPGSVMYKPVGMEDSLHIQYERMRRDELSKMIHDPFPGEVVRPEEKEIIVPDEKPVQQLLDMILDKQAPVQAEIRERNRQRDRLSNRQATIITEGAMIA